jgi:Uma2 family endonuclease
MSVLGHLSEPAPVREEDHFVIMEGISWSVYEELLEARGDSSVPRMTYLDGTLELMAPGHPHESSKTSFARVVERWAEENEIFFEGVGSWTIRKKKKKGGAEADECYFVDRREHERQVRPDIAIEIVYSSGGIDKLEVWRRLVVPEVWIWRKGRLEFHVMKSDGHYELHRRSRLLRALDPALIEECMAQPTQGEAIALLLARLRRR